MTKHNSNICSWKEGKTRQRNKPCSCIPSLYISQLNKKKAGILLATESITIPSFTQKPNVQKTKLLKSDGHLCCFLPKTYCTGIQVWELLNLITLHLLPEYHKHHRAEKLRKWAAISAYTQQLSWRSSSDNARPQSHWSKPAFSEPLACGWYLTKLPKIKISHISVFMETKSWMWTSPTQKTTWDCTLQINWITVN